MQKILRKRILRDLRENLFRYIALSLMIVLGMYLVISVVAAAETIVTGTEDAGKEQAVEDGQFSLFLPLTDEEIQKVEGKGVSIEEHFYLDYIAHNDTVLRAFKMRQDIDRPQADLGSLPVKEGEILLEKRCSEELGIAVGDTVQIGGHSFEVCGIGTAPDYEAPYRSLSDPAIDSSLFGVVFLTESDYEMLKGEHTGLQSEEYVYAYCLNGSMTDKELKEMLQDFTISAEEIEDDYFREYWDKRGGKVKDFKEALSDLREGAEELSDGVSELESAMGRMQESGFFGNSLDDYAGGVSKAAVGAEELADGISEFSDETETFIDDNFDLELSKLTGVLTAEDNMRIGGAGDDVAINKSVGLFAGVLLIVLIAYVISVFVVHTIEKESGVIGTLYALGVKRRELLLHYLILPAAVTFIAGVIGTLIGYSSYGVRIQMQDCYNYFSIPDLKVVYKAYLLVYGIVMPPVAAAVTNFCIIRKKLKKPALQLIRNEQKVTNVKNIRLKGGNFIRIFQIRQFLREKRTAFTVFFGMFFSLLICMLCLNCYVLCRHIEEETKADIKYEYMYTYKYPDEAVPKGGEPAYGVTLKKEVFGYNLDVTLLGIEEDNPYFDAEVKKGQNRVVISSAVARKYHIGTGDELILKDEENDKNYAFTVDGIAPYSASFFVFMDIDSMRKLMGEDEDYYNIVFSDRALSIESGRLYATVSKAELEKSTEVFVELMWPMISTLSIASALIFIVVMYLMLKVMIDRSQTSISMMKIFGYRKKEIRKLYLNGQLLVVAISALIGIPVSKVLMDAAYPYMVSNVAVGVNLSFDWWMYIALFGAIIVLYLVVTPFLMRRINKILPAEVLKNRE